MLPEQYLIFGKMIKRPREIALIGYVGSIFKKLLLPFFGMGVLLLTAFSSGMAQGINRPPEQIMFQIPKTLFLTGEKIWFEAEVQADQKPSPSKVLYVELVDRFSNSVAYAKVPMEEGRVLNYLLLSTAIPSDHYLLRVYTRISPYLDLEIGIAQQFVTVINPKIPPKTAETNELISKRSGGTSSDLIQLSETNPKVGSTFLLSFDNSAEIISSGVSIFNPYLEEEQRQINSRQAYVEIEQRPLLPELFGHIVESRVPQADTSLTYFLSLHGKQSALYTDRADSKGQILFDAGGLSHWDRLIIQLEDGAEMAGLEIISPVVKTKFCQDFNFPVLSIPKTELTFLSQLQKAAAVASYFVEKYDSDSLEVVTGFVADYTFSLDDYTRFETVETVFREYVPSVSVRIRDKKKEFRLLNEAAKNVFDANPLILIDAMPVFDSDLLSGFNPKFLSKLEVLNREFYLNDRTYPGVLSFSSFGNNFGLYPLAPSARFFDYFGLQPKIEFDKSQYTKAGEGGKFPDFRTVLFWGKSQDQSIQASELTGDYLVWVRYLDSNGNVRIARRNFSINP
jgi:hypothetical protein